MPGLVGRDSHRGACPLLFLIRRTASAGVPITMPVRRRSSSLLLIMSSLSLVTNTSWPWKK